MVTLLSRGETEAQQQGGKWVDGEGSCFPPCWGPTFLPLDGARSPRVSPHIQKALSACFSVWQICQAESVWSMRALQTVQRSEGTP